VDLFLGILSFVAIIGATGFWTSAWGPATLSEVLPAFFLFLTSQIILLGYLLSHFNRLAQTSAWLAGCCAFLLLAIPSRRLATSRRREGNARLDWTIAAPRRLLAEIASWSRFQRLAVVPALVSTILLMVLGLAVIIVTVPHESDSLGYHLARVAYYYQHGNLHFFEADYWAIVAHPTNPAILMLYTFIASGRNDHLLPLAQWIAYAVSIAAVYGIARRLGCERGWALLAAPLFALLPDALLESMAAENDLILTAYIACAALFLTEFMRSGRVANLALAGASTALALGVKATALLCLPSLAILMLFVVLECRKATRARIIPSLATFALGFGVGAAGFVLPAGYLENWHRFGNLVGPPGIVASHSYVKSGPVDAVEDGAMNILRYGFDFLSLDGLKFPPVVRLQARVRQPLVHACVVYHLFLDRSTGSRLAFSFFRRPEAHEDSTYWGILGFGLLWLAVLLAVLGWVRSVPAVWLAWATMVFLLAECFLASYDSWRGRYFITCGIFACPVTALLLEKAGARFRAYAGAVILLGCVSAWSGFIIRNAAVLRSGGSMLHPDRLREMLTDRPSLAGPFEEFDRRVPVDATVAVDAPLDSAEYALFGPKLVRRLLPLNSFLRGELPVPAGAQYLLYFRRRLPQPISDINLGSGWYLRKLP
jgi:4-amino-4-deoxy-L-arabinose transferase-like glycosyltransferase